MVTNLFLLFLQFLKKKKPPNVNKNQFTTKPLVMYIIVMVSLKFVVEFIQQNILEKILNPILEKKEKYFCYPEK